MRRFVVCLVILSILVFPALSCAGGTTPTPGKTPTPTTPTPGQTPTPTIGLGEVKIGLGLIYSGVIASIGMNISRLIGIPHCESTPVAPARV